MRSSTVFLLLLLASTTLGRPHYARRSHVKQFFGMFGGASSDENEVDSDENTGGLLGGIADLAGGAIGGAADLAGGALEGAADLAGGALEGAADLAGGAIAGAIDIAGDLGNMLGNALDLLSLPFSGAVLVADLSVQQLSSLATTLYGLLEQVLPAAGIDFCVGGLPRNLVTLVFGGLHNLLSTPFQGVLHDAVLTLLDNEGLEADTLDRVHQVLEFRVQQMDELMTQNFAQQLAILEQALPELQEGSVLAGPILTAFIESSQSGATIGPLVTTTASAIVQALTELGPGTCLEQDDLDLIESALDGIASLLQTTLTDMLGLLETSDLPAGLELDAQLALTVKNTLRGIISELMQNLGESMIPVLGGAIADFENTNILSAMLEFVGEMIPHLNFAFLHDVGLSLPAITLPDLGDMLDTALDLLSLPFSGAMLVADLSVQQMSSLATTLYGLLEQVLPAAGIDFCVGGLPRNLVTLVFGGLNNLLSTPFQGVLHDAVLTLLDDLAIETDTLNSVHQVLEFRMQQMDELMAQNFAQHLATLEEILPELQEGSVLAGPILTAFIESSQGGTTIGPLVTTTASAIVQALTELGPGTCLEQNELDLLASALSGIASLLETTLTDMLQLLETSDLPADLELDVELALSVKNTLRGIISELMQNLGGSMIGVLEGAITDFENTNILTAMLEFLGGMIPHLNFAFLHDIGVSLPSLTLPDLSGLLDAAMSAITLPLSGATLIMDLTLDGLLGIANTITDIIAGVLSDAGIEFCATGLPVNLATFVVGGVGTLLTRPFDGALENTVLTLMDGADLDASTLTQVHHLLETRMNQLDGIMDDTFSDGLAVLEDVLPNIRLSPELGETIVEDFMTGFQAGEAIVSLVPTLAGGMIDALIDLGDGRCLTEQELSLISDTLMQIPTLLGQVEASMLELLQTAPLPTEVTLDAELSLQVSGVLQGAISELIAHLQQLVPALEAAIINANPANTIGAILQFAGELTPHLSLDVLLNEVLPDLSVLLETALSEISLPVAGATLVTELAADEFLALSASIFDVLQNLIEATGLDFCSDGLPRNEVTLVVGVVENLLTFPFQGPLHTTILNLLDSQDLDETTLEQVHQILELRMSQMDNLISPFFAERVETLEGILPELSSAASEAGSLLAECMSLFLEGRTAEDLVGTAANSMYNVLVSLAPGDCLPENEVALLEEALEGIPDLLEEVYTSLVELVDTEVLPSELQLAGDLNALLMNTLRGAVFELVQNLEITIPDLREALLQGNNPNVINILLQFFGQLTPNMNIDFLSELLPPDVEFDLSALLDAAIAEMGLPVPEATLMTDLSLEQMTDLATTVTGLTEYLVDASGLEMCEVGISSNVVTLVFGAVLNLLTLPFHGPLYNTILTLLDDQGLDAATLDQVHQLLDTRLTQMDTLMGETFADDLELLQQVLPGLEQGMELTGSALIGIIGQYQSGETVAEFVSSLTTGLADGLLHLGAGTCLLEDEMTLLDTTLAAIPALLGSAHVSLLELIESEAETELVLSAEVGLQVTNALQGAVYQLTQDLELLIPILRDALITADHSNILESIITFLGQMLPQLNLETLLGNLPTFPISAEDILSGLDGMLDAAMDVIELPVAGASLLMDLAADELMDLGTSIMQVTDHLINAAGLNYCQQGLPLNLVTFVMGGLDTLLTVPFHGPLHNAILTLMDTEDLDDVTLDTVHGIISLRINQMDTLLEEVFSSEMGSLQLVLPGLSEARDVSSVCLTDLLTAFQSGAGVESVVSSAAGALLEDLLQLGSGECLSETDLSAVDASLMAIPTMLEGVYTSLVQLIQTEPLPEGLVIPADLQLQLTSALQGAVSELVQDLQLVIPAIHDDLLSGDALNILGGIMHFLGEMVPNLNLESLLADVMPEGVLPDLSTALEAAISEIGLPLPAATLIADLSMDELATVTTTITDVVGQLLTGTDLEWCETGVPQNLATLVLGSVDTLLTLPFHGVLNNAILSLMDTQALDETTLDRIHEVLELRMDQMDTLLSEAFSSQLEQLEDVITGIELASEMIGPTMAEIVSMYQNDGTLESLVTTSAGAIFSALSELGAGSCMSPDDTSLISTVLTAVPDMLSSTLTSVVQLIETDVLPEELLLPAEVDLDLMTALEAAVYELVQGLEVMMPNLEQALVTGEDSELLGVVLQFLGDIGPQLNLESLLEVLAPEVLPDVSELLEAALEALPLPVPGDSSITDLSIEELTDLTVSITDITSHLLDAAGLDYCDDALPQNVVTLTLGALANLLTFPFHGPLHNAILSLMDSEGLAEDTLDQVHQLLEIRMDQLDGLLEEAFSEQIQALEQVLPDIELGSELSGPGLVNYVTMYLSRETVEPLVTSMATILFNSLVELGDGACLPDESVSLIEATLVAIPDLLAEAHVDLLGLIEMEGLPVDLDLSEELHLDLMDALEGAVTELVDSLDDMVAVLQSALLNGDPTNVLSATIQFLAEITPSLNLESLLEEVVSVPEPTIPDLSSLLDVALSEVGLPVPPNTPALELSQEQNLPVMTAMLQIVENVMEAAGIAYCEDGLPLNHITLTFGELDVLLSYPFHGPLHSTILDMLNSEGLDEAMLTQVQDLLDVRLEQMDSLLATAFSDVLQAMGVVLPELEFAAELAESNIGTVLSLYLTSPTIGQLVHTQTSLIVESLTQVGTGRCLTQDELSSLGSSLATLPTIFVEVHAALEELVETAFVPADLMVPAQVVEDLMTALSAAVDLLVSDLEILVSTLSEGLVNEDGVQIVEALQQFTSDISAGLSMESLLQTFPPDIESELPSLLETAIAEVGLPISGDLPLTDLTAEQTQELTTTISQLMGHVMDAANLVYCTDGLPLNYLTLIFGDLDNLLTRPFHGPLNSMILALLDTQDLDEDTLVQVHQLIEVRMEQMDALLSNAFTEAMEPVGNVLPQIELAVELAEGTLGQMLSFYQTLPTVEDLVNTQTSLTIQAIIQLGSGRCLTQEEITPLSILLSSIPTLLEEASSTLAELLETADLPGEILLPGDLGMDVGVALGAAVDELVGDLTMMVSELNVALESQDRVGVCLALETFLSELSPNMNLDSLLEEFPPDIVSDLPELLASAISEIGLPAVETPVTEMTEEERLQMVTAVSQLVGHVMDAAGLAYCQDALPLNYITLVMGDLANILTMPFYPLLHHTVMTLLDSQGLDEATLEQVHQVLVMKMDDLDTILSDAFAEHLEAIEGVIGPLELSIELTASDLVGFMSAYRLAPSVTELIPPMAQGMIQTLTQLGSGRCLTEAEITSLSALLTGIPDILAEVNVALIEEISLSGLPASLMLSSELEGQLMGLLEAVVNTLVGDLEVIVPELNEALLGSNAIAISNIVINLIGDLQSQLHLETLLEELTPESELEVQLAAAIEEIGLPVPSGTPMLYLTETQRASTVSFMNDLIRYLIQHSEQDFCEQGLPSSLLSLVLGELDAFLTFPFHGPLNSAILSLLDNEGLDEVTLAQVHQLLELRVQQMDDLLDQAFSDEIAELEGILPDVELASGLAGSYLAEYVATYLSGTPVEDVAIMFASGKFEALLQLGSGSCVSDSEISLIETTLSRIPSLLEEAYMSLTDLIETEVLPAEMTFSAELNTQVMNALRGASIELSQDLETAIPALSQALLTETDSAYHCCNVVLNLITEMIPHMNLDWLLQLIEEEEAESEPSEPGVILQTLDINAIIEHIMSLAGDELAAMPDMDVPPTAFFISFLDSLIYRMHELGISNWDVIGMLLDSLQYAFANFPEQDVSILQNALREVQLTRVLKRRRGLAH